VSIALNKQPEHEHHQLQAKMANLRKNTKNNAFEIPLLNDGM